MSRLLLSPTSIIRHFTMPTPPLQRKKNKGGPASSTALPVAQQDESIEPTTAEAINSGDVKKRRGRPKGSKTKNRTPGVHQGRPLKNQTPADPKPKGKVGRPRNRPWCTITFENHHVEGKRRRAYIEQLTMAPRERQVD